MTEHVRVDRRTTVGSVTGVSEQLAERCRCHRREALGDEDTGGLRGFGFK